MKYLLLEKGKIIENNYRGLKRMVPIYEDNYSEDMILNKIWLNLYNNNLDDQGFIIDFEKARSAWKLYKSQGLDYDFIACLDVTEKDIEFDETFHRCNFLGYDITNNILDSLLCAYCYTDTINRTRSAFYSKKNILRIMSLQFFREKLNSCKLVSKYSDAELIYFVEDLITLVHPELNTLHIDNNDDIYIFKLAEVVIT